MVLSLIISFLIFLFISAHILLFIWSRISRGITRSAACLTGKTAIITGANSGLGYQTALNFASRGCRVIMADVADMEESKLNIMKYTGNSDIFTQTLDLSSLRSVRKFAEDIMKTEKRLDILVNNAGIGAAAYNRTEDGLHPVMQVNYFGHFLLTHLLVDLLKKSAPSRIIFTSSAANYFSNLRVHNLNARQASKSVWAAFILYANSKLALLIASDIFNEKLQDEGVTSNAVHPGVVATPIFNRMGTVHAKLFFALFTTYCKIFGKDAWAGSQGIVHAAVSKKLQSTGGKFFIDCMEVLKPFQASDRVFCEKIWLASEKYVDLQPHELL